MRGYLPKIGIIIVITLFLTACGGGGSGGFGTGTGTGESAPAPSMTLTILDSNGAVTTQVNGDIPITVRAVLVDDGGDAIVDTVVKFTSTIGQLTPATGNVLTVAGGIAEIQLGAGTVSDAGTITATATVNSVNVTASTTVQSDGLSTAGDDGDTIIVVELTFTDSTPGNSSNIITSVDNATVTILVVDFFGSALPNRTATVTTSLGTVAVVGGAAAPSITAASDSEGRISVTLTAGAALGTGDFTVVVENVTETLQFDVVIGGLKIGTGTGESFVEGVMDIGLTPLSAGGTSSARVTVVNSSNAAVSGIEIEFSSNCSTKVAPEASISALVTSNTLGVAEATYEASGCEGPDIITATESSSGDTATGTIEVFPPVIGSIVFDSVTDALGNGIETISFKDSGGISTAKVIFQVLDVLGDPVKDKLVAFELSTTVGGIELQNSSALTDDQGKAVAVVNAGFVQTTLKVKASISIDTNNDGNEDRIIDTLSGQLSINTGVADFDSFTLTASELNFEGAILNNQTVTLSVSLADKFNNPVPDGTAVSFRTEFGRIEPSCNTNAGDCSVVLDSTNPRAPAVGTLQEIGVSGCPSDLVFEEVMPIVGDNGDTEYLSRSVLRVEKSAAAGLGEDTRLTEDTDYEVDEDLTGITCLNDTCRNEPSLKITYTRFPDEDNTGDTTHVTTNPGMATEPFRQVTFVPCRTSSVAQGETTSSGYFGGLGQQYGIRSTVLAFAQGEESFVDSNGNGIYDFGETFRDLTEAFEDHNEDNVFGNGTVGVDESRDVTAPGCYGPTLPIDDPLEELGNCFQVGGESEIPVDFNSNSQFDAGNGIYNGTLCPKEISDRTATCDNSAASPCVEATSQYCTRDLLHISRSGVIVFSGSSAAMSLRDASFGEYISAVDLTNSGLYAPNTMVKANNGANINANTPLSIGHGDSQVAPHIGDTVNLETGGSTVIVDYADPYNAKMPAETSISVAVTDGGCLIGGTFGSTVMPSTNGTGVSSIGIALLQNTGVVDGSNIVTVTITTPSGVASSLSFGCRE